MGKNKIQLTIEDCQYCPCASLKYDSSVEKDHMYCIMDGGIIMLREDWGSRNIPDWCPVLERAKKRDLLEIKRKYRRNSK